MDSHRPKPKCMVFYDTNNYYSQLGISPLMSTDEIKLFITKKQNEARNESKGKSRQDLEKANDTFIRLQKILDNIGNRQNREEYDYHNPQNQILTVQPDQYDQWLDNKKQASMITAVLFELLGHESLLPHPNSLPLWMPPNDDKELKQVIHDFLNSENNQLTP